MFLYLCSEFLNIVQLWIRFKFQLIILEFVLTVSYRIAFSLLNIFKIPRCNTIQINLLGVFIKLFIFLVVNNNIAYSTYIIKIGLDLRLV